jgi:hypothetical protein
MEKPFMHEILYVNKCLQLIEAKLNWGNRENWVYDDFKRLQHLIFESSSISLSVHTLERLFGKLKTHRNYNPQAETKNALAAFLGYKNWAQFREQNPIREEEKVPAPAAGEAAASALLRREEKVNAPIIPQPAAGIDPLPEAVRQHQPATQAVRQPAKRIALWAVLFLALMAALFFFFRQQLGVNSSAAVRFKATNSYGQSPHTVKFTYRIPDQHGQSPHTVKFTYRIPDQLSQEVYADFGLEDPLWKVDRKEKSFYKTYLPPGVFRVRLMTRDSLLAQTNVFIDSKGWMGFKYDVYEDLKTRTSLPQHALMSQGRLYTSPRLGRDRKEGIYFYEYTTIKDFQVSGDNLIFDTRFRSRAENGGELCNDMWFKLIGTEGELKMHFLVPGCFGFVQMIFGEQKLDGHTRDLSAFAREIDDWKNARMEVVNKKVSIYFEDKLIYQTTYQKPIGKIMGISVTSKGAGETDYVKLYNARKELVFADGFGD